MEIFAGNLSREKCKKKMQKRGVGRGSLAWISAIGGGRAMSARKRGEVPEDFFDSGGDGGGGTKRPRAEVKDPDDNASKKSKEGDEAFAAFMMEVNATEAEGPAEESRGGTTAAVVAGPVSIGGAREEEDEEEDEDDLVSRGRAAVWRQLVEERKKAASEKPKVEEAEGPGESDDDDDDDDDDIDDLTDWRRKGI